MSKIHLEALANVLADQTRVLILPHNDPDPDAIAAAVGLRYLLKEKFHTESLIAYRGHIEREENKAFVQYLEKPLRHFQSSDLQSASKIALVDTQPGVGNNPLPPGWMADIVIDHHVLRTTPQNAHFMDIRPDVGASATILTNYLIEAEIDLPSQLATALFFGIKTDTMGLSRNTSPLDVEAYFYLQPIIDVEALVQIEQAQVPLAYFQSIDGAIRAGRIYDKDIIMAYVGKLSYPDLSAELADFFMRLKGIQWVFCMGVFRNELILSVRTRNNRIGAGTLVSTLIGGKGTAGGHGTMAAGHLKLKRGDDPQKLTVELENSILLSLKGTHDVAYERMV